MIKGCQSRSEGWGQSRTWVSQNPASEEKFTQTGSLPGSWTHWIVWLWKAVTASAARSAGSMTPNDSKPKLAKTRLLVIGKSDSPHYFITFLIFCQYLLTKYSYSPQDKTIVRWGVGELLYPPLKGSNIV